MQSTEPEEMEEELEKKKSPLKYILAAVLVFILVLMIIPYYGVKLDPRPSYTPTIEEVLPENIILENQSHKVNSLNDFKKFVNPNDQIIRDIAVKIATSSCKKSKVCQAKAIYYFVRDNIKYVSDPHSLEYAETAKEVLITGGSDCDGHVILLMNLEESIGIKSRFVFIPQHVYIQIYLPEALKSYKSEDDWISLDATCKDCDFGEIPYQNLKKEKTYLEI